MTVQDASLPPGMGTCSITGKVVPEDELVTIHGQRVCAEGKAILLDRLKAGDALPGEEERPTALRRFGCLFLDGLIINVPGAIIIALIVAVFVPHHAADQAAMIIGLFALFLAAVQFVYFGLTHAIRGQTLGKMAGKIVVVNLDGSPISASTAYIRALAFLGPNLLAALLLVVGLAPIAAVLDVISRLWILADAIVALVDRDQQRSLHDRIAGTRVVMKG